MAVDFYPLSVAARELSRSLPTVRGWVNKNEIPTWRIGSARCVNGAGLKRLREIDRASPRLVAPSGR